ncbi:MAG TPA: hypothetical protein VFF94_17070, partial [Novosphingobium sp.]|nr:hypothetical protein [Novosphingobium sp.]
EETLGLSGSISGLTTAQRSAQVLSRFIANGGQSIAFLTSFAATLGFAITITTYARCRAGIATAGSPVYAENWASALGIHITANTSGLASSALIAALSPIISAHVAIFLV